jgi:hypothetical protein
VPLSDAAKTLADITANIDALHAGINALPALIAKTTEGIDELGDSLKNNVKVIDKITDGFKAARKEAIDSHDFQKTNKELQKTYEALRKNQRQVNQTSKEYFEITKRMKLIKEYQEEFKDNIAESNGKLKHMNDDELKKTVKLMDKLTDGAGKFSEVLKNVNLGHVSRQIHSISKSFSNLGLFKNFSRKMDKYTEGAAIKQATLEHKKLRKEGNAAGAQERKLKAMELVKKNYPKLIDPVTGELDMTKRASRFNVGKNMGMSRAQRMKFQQGDEVGAFEHGGQGGLEGGIKTMTSKMAGAMEDVSGEIAGLAADFAAPLAALEMLREGFDKQVKQNKGMEAGLGKSGLFAHGGTGFDAARQALNAPAFNSLGLNWDRNLKIAQAVQEGGRGMKEVSGGGLGESAGEGLGTGGFGQFQRIAVGAGRMAGLTDTEGVGQTIKLLDQYTETMKSSEDFFIKVKKGADASGLSTMKYIGLIDDVNSHFTRMNKSLDATLGMLGELGKTGRMGAADLQAYFNFISGGGGPKSLDDASLTAFSKANQTPERTEIEKAIRQDQVEQAFAKVSTGQYVGEEDKKAILAGGPGAQAAIQRLLYDNQNIPDDDNKGKDRAAALTNLMQRNDKRQALLEGGGVTKQSVGLVGNADITDTSLQTLNNLEAAITKSGGTLEEFFNSGGAQSYATAHPKFKAAAMEFHVADQGEAGFTAMSQNSQTMLKNLSDMDMETDPKAQALRLATAKKLLKEMSDKKVNQKYGFSDEDVDRVLKAGPDDTGELAPMLATAFQQHGREMANFVGGSNTAFNYPLDAQRAGSPLSKEEEDKTMKAAAEVGFRTQETGELIANAFSSWFVSIIGLLNKILDALHPFGGGKADRDAAAASASQPAFQKMLQTSVEGLEKKIKEQNDIIQNPQSTPKQRTDAEAARRKVQTTMDDLKNAPLGMDDLWRKRGEMMDQAQPGRSMAEQDRAAAVANMLDGRDGVSVDDLAGTTTFTAAAVSANADLIAAAERGGDMRDRTTDQKGNVTWHLYSAPINQNPVASNALAAISPIDRPKGDTVAPKQ